MRKATAILIFCAVALPVLGQTRARVQTATRLVTIFSNLENQLMDAMVAKNSGAAERLVADDFAQWTPIPPGDPTPRQEWLKTDRSDMADYRIQQMSVKDLGDHAAASFVLTAIGRAWFVVDIWKKAGSDWQLESRYLSPTDPAPYRGAIKPSGKN